MYICVRILGLNHPGANDRGSKSGGQDLRFKTAFAQGLVITVAVDGVDITQALLRAVRDRRGENFISVTALWS